MRRRYTSLWLIFHVQAVWAEVLQRGVTRNHVTWGHE